MLEMESLNANQREAAEWNDGPMLVLAGPGSGKTLVLTMRVARLIQESPESRFKVLGLTFTTKAADEMRSRVAQRLGLEAQRAHLTTFHSFAAGSPAPTRQLFRPAPGFQDPYRGCRPTSVVGRSH